MTETNRLVKRVATGLALVLAASAWAMPTKQQLAEAQQIVKDLTAADIRALNAKEKTAAAVAATHLALADKADTEAGKYLLLQGAFRLYARSGDYDAAAAVLQRMRGEIAGLPPELIVEIVNNEMRRVAADKAPKVLAIFRDAQRMIKYRKQLAAAELNAKANPENSVFARRLAECHASLGNWPKTLEIFAKFGNTAAKFELDPASAAGYDAVKAADFWWGYKAADPEPFKAHAASLYRTALDANLVSGLKREVVTQRLAEIEANGAAVAAAPLGRQMSSPAVAVGTQKAPASKTLRLDGGVNIEFMGCPAGSFMMGDPKDNSPRSAYRYHKVYITRPFWLSKFKVTHGMWNAYQKVSLTKEDNALGGMKRVHVATPEEMDAFCEWLTKRFRSNLPPKYVIRIPTEAEWEYACKANVTDSADPYFRMCNLSPDGFAYIIDSRSNSAHLAFPEVTDYVATWLYDAYPRLQSAGLFDATKEEKPNHIRMAAGVYGTEVGTKKPNAWGFYDMVGNCGEITADTMDQSLIKGNGWNIWDRRNTEAICYEAEETDPLHLAPQGASGKRWLVRGGNKTFGWRTSASGKDFHYHRGIIPFRLCIGPDLLAEKTAAAKK